MRNQEYVCWPSRQRWQTKTRRFQVASKSTVWHLCMYVHVHIHIHIHISINTYIHIYPYVHIHIRKYIIHIHIHIYIYVCTYTNTLYIYVYTELGSGQAAHLIYLSDRQIQSLATGQRRIQNHGSELYLPHIKRRSLYRDSEEEREALDCIDRVVSGSQFLGVLSIPHCFC